MYMVLHAGNENAFIENIELILKSNKKAIIVMVTWTLTTSKCGLEINSFQI